jgi:FKBP-type peptidyl-prolyl cis-trans isomerase FkpA
MSAVTAVPIRPIARGSVLKLWLGLFVLLAVGAGLAWLGTAPVQRTTTASGLQYRVLKAGTGPTATANDVLVFHYDGRKTDGTLFDSSRRSGEPMVMPPVGLIPGFVEGLQLTQAGGRYRIWIPPNLGYGPGRVPPNAPFTEHDTLVFDIEVMRIVPDAAGMWQMQRMQQMQQQMQSQGGMPPGGADPPGGVPPEGGAPPPTPPGGGR